MIKSFKEFLRHSLNFIQKLISAFGKFFSSSYLSLLFLGIIFILINGLEQVNTLLVDMVESNDIDLYITFFIIAAFSSVLAHYPRYIYYAKNINDSRDDHYWYINKVLIYSSFTFAKIKGHQDYKIDYKAKYFRYCLGLVIFIILHYYIDAAFYPKLLLHSNNLGTLNVLFWVFVGVPPVLLIVLLDKYDRIQEKREVVNKKPDVPNDKAEYENNTLYLTSSQREKALEDINEEEEAYSKLGATALIFCFFSVAVVVLVMALTLKLNVTAYVLLQLLTFLLALQYVLLRVFRVHLSKVSKRLKLLENNFYYLTYYRVLLVVLIACIIIWNIRTIGLKSLPNGLLILLSYMYLFYYLLACGNKYFFVLKAIGLQVKNFVSKDKKPIPKDFDERKKFYSDPSNFDSDKLRNYWESEGSKGANRRRLLPVNKQYAFVTRRFAWATGLTFVFLVLFVLSFFNEERLHELQLHPKSKNEKVVTYANFTETLKTKNTKPIFFVASEGGGLKANIWTMKLLRKIQEETEGQFLNQTASFSGASGGMMGLSLYSVLENRYKKSEKPLKEIYTQISGIIDDVAKKNFASKDMTMTLGADFARKLYGPSFIGSYRDRSYYSLLEYQNLIKGIEANALNTKSFKSYWKTNVYDPNTFFPALIVNTAKTNGRRGVFFSLDCSKEDPFFFNVDLLSDLPKGDIAYYEAVSSTNRFPGLSPAAKIDGSGHYIDAGAIDNSGLLSSLDFYQKLMVDRVLTDSTKVVFVQIINSKSNYVKHLLDQYKKQNNLQHIDFEEIERDNLIADLQTGLNLDKIPNYLMDFLSNYQKLRGNFSFEPIYLPFHVTVDDIEGALGGTMDYVDRKRVCSFLEKHNRLLIEALKDNNASWSTYEPTLARHLSQSTINYYDRVLDSHKDIQNIVKSIEEYLDN